MGEDCAQHLLILKGSAETESSLSEVGSQRHARR